MLNGKCSVLYKVEWDDDHTVNMMENAIRTLKKNSVAKMKINEKKEFFQKNQETKFSHHQRLKSKYNGIQNTIKSLNSRVEWVENMGFVVYYRHVIMKKVASLYAGTGFGGMALKIPTSSKDEGKRNASIFAEEDMACLVLGRAVYNVIFFFRF